MSELHQGMLALVIGCTRNPVNIGKIVIAEKKVHAGYIGPDGILFTGDYAWLVKGENLGLYRGDKIVNSDFCYIAEPHLLPIKPEADPLDVTHKEELHA